MGESNRETAYRCESNWRKKLTEIYTMCNKFKIMNCACCSLPFPPASMKLQRNFEGNMARESFVKGC
jgi:hypothetical protein